MPETLYDMVVEVEERVVLQQDLCQLNLDSALVIGRTKEQVHMHMVLRS